AEILNSFAPDDPIDPGELVGNLSVARLQSLERAKTLSRHAGMLGRAGPSAAVAAHEVDSPFRHGERLRERAMAILYISHRLREIFELAARITVLKDGQKVKTVMADEVTSPELVQMMVGRELDQYFPPLGDPSKRGEVRLRIR